jgi:diguanylate cyclase (GGDEF)-like protein
MGKSLPSAEASAYALFLEGDELADFGQYESAIAAVTRAAELLRATKDPYWRAVADAELCDVYWGTEQSASAMPYCRRAEKYFRSVSDDWFLARLENVIAMLLAEQDEQDPLAVELATSARARFQKLEMTSMMAMMDDNLSSLYLARGDAKHALELSQGALTIELAAGKINHAVSSYVNVALAQSALGLHTQALNSVDQALRAASDVGLESRKDAIYRAQMEIAEAAGNWPLAIEAARKAMEAAGALQSEQQKRAIAEMQARYTAVEQKREIERLDHDQRVRELELARSQEVNARQAEQLARQNLWLWLVTVAIAGLALITLLLFALWRASRRHAQRMRVLADTDALTQVLNRRAFLARLQIAYQRCAQSGEGGSVALVDADYFKQINDTRGHQIGDLALQRIVAALAAALRPTDCVGRLGGEEFAMLLVGADVDQARRQSEMARGRVAHDHEQMGGLGFPMTVSIGVASLDLATMATADDWLQAADRALYRAKAGGRNRVVVATAGRDESGTPLQSELPQPG